MTVKLTADYRKILTPDELDSAKRLIEEFKTDELSTRDYFMIAAQYIGAGRIEVIKADAQIAKNFRVWNYFSDYTVDLDVWIEGMFIAEDGVYIVDAYLSDIWYLGPETKSECINNMCIRHFVEQ